MDSIVCATVCCLNVRCFLAETSIWDLAIEDLGPENARSLNVSYTIASGVIFDRYFGVLGIRMFNTTHGEACKIAWDMKINGKFENGNIALSPGSWKYAEQRMVDLSFRSVYLRGYNVLEADVNILFRQDDFKVLIGPFSQKTTYLSNENNGVEAFLNDFVRDNVSCIKDGSLEISRRTCKFDQRQTLVMLVKYAGYESVTDICPAFLAKLTMLKTLITKEACFNQEMSFCTIKILPSGLIAIFCVSNRNDILDFPVRAAIRIKNGLEFEAFDEKLSIRILIDSGIFFENVLQGKYRSIYRLLSKSVFDDFCHDNTCDGYVRIICSPSIYDICANTNLQGYLRFIPQNKSTEHLHSVLDPNYPDFFEACQSVKKEPFASKFNGMQQILAEVTRVCDLSKTPEVSNSHANTLIIEGCAGSGKTHVLKAIMDLMSEKGILVWYEALYLVFQRGLIVKHTSILYTPFLTY